MASAASLGDQLVRLVGRRYHHTPPLVELEAFMSQLRRLVDAGAPLTARITTAFHPLYDEQDQLPVLSYLILQGELDAVMACLRSPHPIDFTAASAIGGSPVLHELLTPTLPSSSSSSSVDTAAAYSKALVEAVVERIAQHPQDLVDWAQQNADGATFISLTASHQLLSVVWPLLRDVAYFADRLEPIALDSCAVWAHDLQHLPEGERQMFQTEGAILFTANASTARLWQAAEILTRCKPLLHFGDDVCLPASGEIWMLQKRRANEAMVRGWTDVTEKSVAEGADVMFKSTLAVGCPTLTRLVSEGQLEAALACLETRLPIDFTVTDSYGKTPLHAAAETLIASEAFSLTILRAIRQRLERHPGRDLIEWWQLDDDGKHFLDSAAAHQLLAAFWAEVRGFAAVTGAAAGKEGKEPAVVRLSTPTWQWDWNDMLVQDPTASAGRLQLQLLAEGDGAIRLPGSRATARLWLLMERPREWMEDFIPQMRQCVAEGADLLHQMQRGSPYGAAPLLSHALYAASIPVVQALLEAAPRDSVIDFNVPDEEGSTLLHYISMGRQKSSEWVWALLHCVADRLLVAPPEEAAAVNWSARNAAGLDPISLGAQEGFLVVWVQVVLHERPIPYYTAHPGLISLQTKGKPQGWDMLPPEDQSRFSYELC